MKHALTPMALTPMIAALALMGSLCAPQMTYAAAPQVSERPSDQRSGAATNAIERERRYAGLDLGDAVRQALIDDDLDFAYSTLTALGLSDGDGLEARYFRGLRAFARADFSETVASLKDTKPDDIFAAAIQSWALAGMKQSDAAAKLWDDYGDSGQKPFYPAYRAALAEYSGETEAALRHYKIAESVGEIVFTKDLAQRYAVLLVEGGQGSAALRLYDDIFGPAAAMDTGQQAFRQSLVAGKPLAQDKIDPRAMVSKLMSNFAEVGRFARALQAKKAVGEAGSADATPPKAPDADAMFINDTMVLRSALLVNPANVDARLDLARLLSGVDEDDAARIALEAVKSGPRLMEAQMLLATVYASLEMPQKGLALLDQIPEAGRDGEWWSTRADLMAARGTFDEAVQAADRGLALAKGKGVWLERVSQIARANILHKAGRVEEARRVALSLYGKMEKDNPLRGALAHLLMSAPATKARGLSAARDVLKAFGTDGNRIAGVGGLLVKDPATRNEGLDLLRQAQSELPRSPSLMNALGYSLVIYDIDLEEGFKLLQKAHEARPNSGAITDSLGVAHYKLGNLDEAQRLIERAIVLREQSPDPEIYDNLGNVYWHQGKPDDARAQWRKALAIGGYYDGAAQLPLKIRDGLTTPKPVMREVPVVAEPGSV
ncbi:MAG: hypothetical protein RL186_1181 [Pseudomonadota bacterium]